MFEDDIKQTPRVPDDFPRDDIHRDYSVKEIRETNGMGRAFGLIDTIIIKGVIIPSVQTLAKKFSVKKGGK